MNKSKYQEAIELLKEYRIGEELRIVDKLNYNARLDKIIDLLQELVDKFELIKTISKQNYEDCWKEWIRYGEYEDKGRASAFSQILRLIKDDKDE